MTTDRVGYCEQYAAAMAVMARSLGIPTRVAVGFRSAVRSGDEYVYRSHQMHSWPEIYFPHTGWLPFEPTPGAAGGAVPSYTQTGLTTGGGPSATATPSPQPTQIVGVLHAYIHTLTGLGRVGMDGICGLVVPSVSASQSYLSLGTWGNATYHRPGRPGHIC